MSLSSSLNRNDYTGNGSVDTYAYGFKIFSDSHLVVTVRDLDDVETTLTKTTHYTVTGVGNTSGGNVVLVAGAFDWLTVGNDLKSGYTLTIRRVIPLVQETDIRNAGTFYPSIHEDQFDKQVMISQQQQDQINRSVKLPETVPSSDFDPTLPADILDSADKVPKMNASGDGFADVADWPTAIDIATASASAAAAAASAAAALVSETNAAASETAAGASETNAAASETAAGISEAAAAVSETNAAASEAAAALSETNAAASEAAAALSETNAAASEAAAALSETNAAASEAAAALSETNAAASEAASAVSAAASASSAASAAAALASALFRDVVLLTSASSPYTVTQADNGKLLDINSSGGAITINLPTIAGLALPFNVAIKLTTAGNNVTINRGGTDTIVGATTATLTAAGTGLQLIADTDGSPDNWSTLDIGSVADGSITLAKLAAAVAEALVPKGAMLPYGGGSVPTGWLFCNGRAVSRTTYADLYSAIGDRYGSGDGSTTFNLPETRYEFLRGYGGIANVTGSGSAASNNGTFTAHGYTKSGTKVRLSSGTLSGLSASTDYYVIYVDANTLAFATSRANALAGTKIAISGSNSAVIRQWEDPDATSRVASASGGATGDSVGSVQEESYLSHTHIQDSHNHTQNAHAHGIGTGFANANSVTNLSSVTTRATTNSTDSATATNIATTATNQNSGGNETRPQNFSAMMIIKY